MSFILDALRKSESERQRSQVPGIAHVPLAVARPTLPVWAIAVMAVLGASAVAMAGAWWLALDARGERTAAAEPPARTALALPEPAEPAQPVPLPRAAETRDDGALRAAAAAPAAQPLQQSAAGAAVPRAAAGAPRADESRRAAAPPPPAIPVDLPSAADLVASGEDLPSLRLELHVFGAAPADRYVFINGKMYREGDTLREGPELVQIDQRGAALRHRGRDFLLTQ